MQSLAAALRAEIMPCACNDERFSGSALLWSWDSGRNVVERLECPCGRQSTRVWVGDGIAADNEGYRR